MGYHPTLVFIYTPIQPRNIDLLRVSIYPSSPAAADIGYGNIGYCPTSVSIYPPCQPEIWVWDVPPTCQYLSIRPSAADIGYGILPHVCVYLYPFPSPKYGYGIRRLHVEDGGYAPCAPPDPSETSPRQ